MHIKNHIPLSVITPGQPRTGVVAFDTPPGGLPHQPQGTPVNPKLSMPNFNSPQQRGWRYFLQSRARPKTAIRGNDPSVESMQFAEQLSSRYGAQGQNLSLAYRVEREKYLCIEEVRPTELQKNVFLVHNINQPAMECIRQANQRGEPVRAVVFGAELGADAFFMAKSLQSRAEYGAEVMAVDIDSNATLLMEKTKQEETRRLMLGNVRGPSDIHSAKPAREGPEWLAALQSTTVFHGDADAALERVRPDKPLHLATASATFSYIPDLGRTLAKLSSAMREGGVLVFDVYGDTHQKLDKPLRLYSQQQIRDVLDQAGFEVVHVYEKAPARQAFHNVYVAAVKRGGTR